MEYLGLLLMTSSQLVIFNPFPCYGSKDQYFFIDGYCPTNYQGIERIVGNGTASLMMTFNDDGPVTGSNGLLELDPANNNCPIGFQEFQFLIYPESPFFNIILSILQNDLTITEETFLESVFSLLELLVRRPTFYPCGNNCPGGQ